MKKGKVAEKLCEVVFNNVRTERKGNPETTEVGYEATEELRGKMKAEL